MRRLSTLSSRGLTLLVFALAALAIMVKSLIDSNGYMSPDSCNYLMLARTLLETKSYHVYGGFIYEPDSLKFMATWPVGYPLLIALVCAALGIPVFLASKILNIIILGIIFWIFDRVFREDGWLYSSMFLAMDFLEIFSFTWSEVPFTLGALWFVVALHRQNNASNRYFWNALNVLLSVWMLFLSRYVGAFALGVAGLSMLYLLYRKQHNRALWLLIPLVLGASFVGAYLMHNKSATGFTSGMPRMPSDATGLDFLRMCTVAVLSDLNVMYSVIKSLSLEMNRRGMIFYGTLLMQILILYWVFLRKGPLHRSRRTKDASDDLWLYFLVTGLMYYGCMMFLRSRNTFDSLVGRMTFPGFFLVLTGIITYLKTHLQEESFGRFKKAFLWMVSISYFLFFILPTLNFAYKRKKPTTYYEHVSKLRERIRDIPPGSVLVFRDDHHLYLRSDIIYARPYIKPLFPEVQEWGPYVQKLKNAYPDRRIFVLIQKFEAGSLEENLFKYRYHPTVYEFMQRNKDANVIEL